MAKLALPEKLRICLITKKFPIQGRAADHSYLFQIAKGLVSKGHEVVVIASESPQNLPEIFQDGVQAFFLQYNNRYKDSDYLEAVERKFAQLHNEKIFDIVHCVDRSGYKVITHKKRYNIVTAVDVEATYIAQLFSIMGMAQENTSSALRTAFAVTYKFLKTYLGHDRKLLKNANGVFVSSPQQRLALERYYLYADAKIYTVAYGIDLASGEKEINTELRDNLSIPQQGQNILCISDMNEINEIIHILQAFEKVVIKKPESRLIIVGNGPYRKRIEYETLMLAMGNKVIFTGAVKNIELPDYIALADIVVNISSRTTGFEASILEAMAQKKIVIGSEVSAISSLIEHQVDGFLIRPADINGLSNLILEIINGTQPVSHMGESARQKVLEFSDLNNMISNSISAYYSILKSTKKYKA